MTDTRPMYLFSPVAVEERIMSLPRVGDLLGKHLRDGEPSAAYPMLLKTDREILRILGRSEGFPRLDALLLTLESCLHRGWDAHQLGTRDRDEFASLVSELAVVEHCLLRAFSIRSTIGLRTDGPKPDLLVSSDGHQAVIEVFRPRELHAFHAFDRDVSRLFLEADVQLDFRSSVDLRLLSDFSPDGQLISPPHPIDLDDALAPVVDDALARLADALSTAAPTKRVELVGEWPDQNLTLECELSDIHRSVGDEPARLVGFGKSYGSYDPIGMLRRLIGPIVRKAKKRQAGDRGEAARVLVCDVGGTVVLAHLDEHVRTEQFVEVLVEELTQSVQDDYDVIALCEHTDWGESLRTYFVVCGARYNDISTSLFGELETQWDAEVFQGIA
jgi:hypothetical protein